MSGHEFRRSTASLFVKELVIQQPVHFILQFQRGSHREAATRFHQLNCFNVFIVYGSEQHRLSIDSSFQYIMYSISAEAPAHERDAGIAVKTGKQAYAVDDHYVRIGLR